MDVSDFDFVSVTRIEVMANEWRVHIQCLAGILIRTIPIPEARIGDLLARVTGLCLREWRSGLLGNQDEEGYADNVLKLFIKAYDDPDENQP
jgi:hypothetical protein